MAETRWYGVSSGNGNDGVSQSWPDYWVQTDDPWRVAKLALITIYKAEYRQFAIDNMEVDGEEDYTISAVLYEGPNSETAFEAALDIIEVFPDDPPDTDDICAYTCIEDCFGDDADLIL